MYGNATDFYLLILYSSPLQKLIRSNSFLVESCIFSLWKIMLSENSNNFTSSFLMWVSFISLSCLLALVRTFSTFLSKSGENGNPCLIPGFGGKAFNFSSLNIMSAAHLSYMTGISSLYWCIFLLGEGNGSPVQYSCLENPMDGQRSLAG